MRKAGRLEVLGLVGPGGAFVAGGDRGGVTLDALELVQDSQAVRAECEDRPAEPFRRALGRVVDRVAPLGPEQLREGDHGGALLCDGGLGGECVIPVEDPHQRIGGNDDGHQPPTSAGAEKWCEHEQESGTGRDDEHGCEVRAQVHGEARVVAGHVEAALDPSTQYVRGEYEQCHDADRHEAGHTFVAREPWVGAGCGIRCRAACGGTSLQHVDEHREQHSEAQVRYHGVAALESLAPVERHRCQQMAEGLVAAREHDALDDQHVPDPERPPARPAARGALGEGKGRDEWHDADRIAQLGQVVGAEKARKAEVPVTADQKWHEEQFQVVPGQRSCREATEGDGRSFGLVHEAEAWKPLGRGKAHCEKGRHHHGDTGDSDTPARTPCSPADGKEVRDHDDRDTGGGARITGKHHKAAAAAQQRDPAPSCAWLG